MTLDKLTELLQPIRWQNNQLQLLDQRALPLKQVWLSYDKSCDVALAITNMVVRGAPAIGITAAYGVVLAARQAFSEDAKNWMEVIVSMVDELAKSRPTAVNLHWALARMTRLYSQLNVQDDPEMVLLQEAHLIHQEDIAANRVMGQYGSDLLDIESVVLTHCNAGALATGGVGTALGVIRQGYTDGKISHVYANETRPWLQGARLTAWELQQEGIPVTLQTEGAAAALMATGTLSWVIVGADRITANGDVANKIGTYMLAILAKYHGVKVMVVAPTSTIDWSCESGNEIPIEQRPRSEVTSVQGVQIAPEGINVSNPAFDVTPAHLIDVIVTEKGVVHSPSLENMNIIQTDN